MKKLIIILFVLISTHSFSQEKDIKLLSKETKNEIISDSIFSYFIKKINLNLNDYCVLPLYQVVDTTSFLKKNNTKFKVVSRKIFYDSLKNYEYFFNEKKYNIKFKKTLKTKFLCCYRSLEISNNKFFIEFYSIE
jgi:riboflavin transporter FmnP